MLITSTTTTGISFISNGLQMQIINQQCSTTTVYPPVPTPPPPTSAPGTSLSGLTSSSTQQSENDLSIEVRSLQMKYLDDDQLANSNDDDRHSPTPPSTVRQSPQIFDKNMSFATQKYFQKYNIVSGYNRPQQQYYLSSDDSDLLTLSSPPHQRMLLPLPPSPSQPIFTQPLAPHAPQAKILDLSQIPSHRFRRRYLPLFIDQINSIYLSDDDTNPNEIDLFLSRLYPIYRFQNLISITFSHIYSIQKILRILNDLQQITTLNILKFKKCYFSYDPKNLLLMINQSWSLNNLIECYLDIFCEENSYLITPTIISCSIQYLSINGFKCGLENLQLLTDHTPYLQNLSIDISEVIDENQSLSLIISLTKLNLKCQTSSKLILFILKKLPNLINLTIETKNIRMDGHMWEILIQKYLLNLKNLNLQMKFELNNCDDLEQEINELINTYKTDFWIKQHQWFIRCLSYTKNESNIVYLHTFPYKLKSFSIDINDNDNLIYKSTYPNDRFYSLYRSVTNLDYSCLTSEEINLPEIKCLNIENLILTLPYDDHFRFIVPKFDNLIYLQIRMITWGNNENDLFQLQTILDQSPRLYYLKFHSWSTNPSKIEYKNKKNSNTISWKMPPFSIRSSSVRYLNLQGLTPEGDYQYYNEQQCLSIIRSPLGQQCQYLIIEVEKRTNIIEILTKMTQLRSLNVRCRDRKKNDNELIKWLQQQRLPSTCSFAKDPKSPYDIRLWIR